MRKISVLPLWFFIAAAAADEPPMMLVDNYHNQHIGGWVMSEKLDGVRGYWDGRKLLTRTGQPLFPPSYFTEKFPPFAIDGELFSERGQFEQISGITRSAEDKGWHKLKLYVFDVPEAKGGLFERLAVLEKYLAENPTPYIRIIEQIPLPPEHTQSSLQLREFLAEVESVQGEGVIVRNPAAPYENKRSTQILKLKSEFDEECTVIAYHKGKGQFENAMGSLTCRNHRGEFKIGSGFSLQERIQPPPIGALISYKYRGLTKNGKPRFATYWRERKE